MKANVSKIRKYMRYSEEFQRKLVAEYESGAYSVCQLERLYKVPNTSIYRWIYKYSNFNEKGYRVMEHHESSSEKLKTMEARLKDLEAIVGQKQIMIDYLEKIIDLAKSDLGVDIKKNYNTPQSNSSERTERS